MAINHAEWERWIADWDQVDFDAYPAFSEWQMADGDEGRSQALNKVLDQAETSGDIKMVRKVYYHAIRGSAPHNRALHLTLEHARRTKDSLLARDVYQHSLDGEAAKAAYAEITGYALTT